jgi:hypothetical protein
VNNDGRNGKGVTNEVTNLEEEFIENIIGKLARGMNVRRVNMGKMKGMWKKQARVGKVELEAMQDGRSNLGPCKAEELGLLLRETSNKKGRKNSGEKITEDAVAVISQAR